MSVHGCVLVLTSEVCFDATIFGHIYIYIHLNT